MKVLAAFCLAAMLLGAAPASPITVGENVHVSAAYANIPVREMVLAADPKNPNHLLGCATISGQQQSYEWIAAFVSDDRGQTWRRTLDTRNLNMNGDPACTLAPNGVASAVSMNIPWGRPPGSSSAWGLAIFRSADGGHTWTTRPQLPMGFQGMDNEFLIPDATGGKYNGRLYISGTTHVRKLDSEQGIGLAIWRSTDHGRSFDHIVKRESGATHYVLGQGGGVVMPDGTLVTIFGELYNYDWKTNGISRAVPGKPNGMLEVVTSDDGGDSMSEASKIDDYWMVYGYDFANDSEPGLAVDSTHGPFRNRLYATWADVRSGHSRIYVAHSSDKGKTWTKAVAIDDQSITDVAHDWGDFSPEIAVNDNGVLGAMWYDRRNFKTNNGWQTRFASSTDGGETWTPSVAVSSAPNTFTPATSIMTSPGGASGSDSATMTVNANERQFNAGDYSGMVADAGGLFHPFWIDNRTGLPQIWTAQVNVDGRAQKFGDPNLNGYDNVSGSVFLRLADSRWDRASGEVTFSASMQNISKKPIYGPLKVRITGMQSELAGAVDYAGGDPVVDFSDTLTGGELKPGQRTAAKDLTFRLVDQRNVSPGPDFKSQLVQVSAQILAHLHK